MDEPFQKKRRTDAPHAQSFTKGNESASDFTRRALECEAASHCFAALMSSGEEAKFA
jgi:hypothetical protein